MARAGTSNHDPALTLRIGSKFGDDGRYVICNERGEISPERRAKAVGAGGAGAVYLAKYSGSQIRAVKFLTLNYLNEDETGQRESDFVTTFQRERELLYKLSHSNITTLHDSGTYVDDKDNNWQFLVTENIAGPMLSDALAQDDLDGDDIYKMFGDLISAVAYLNQNGVYHCDVKTQNIRLRRAEHSYCDVVLLDWGAAQVLPPGIATQTALIPVSEDERRRFVSTNRITHASHRPYLGGKRLTQSELMEFIPSHELHTLGILLKEALAVTRVDNLLVETVLAKSIGRAGVTALKEIIEDLLQAPGKESIHDSGALASDFAKLHRNYLSPAGTPELSLAAEFHFSTPTATGRTTVTPRLGRVVEHKTLQRLRDIPQLEYTSLKFAGATHTRLSHSLAVLRNCRYYLAHLLNDARFRRVAEPSELQAAVLLSLLHDLGHFQLSHMFEDLATSQRSATESNFWSGIKFDIPTDDDLFPYMLAGVSADLSGTQLLRGGYGSTVQAATQESFERLGLEGWGAPIYSLADVISSEFGQDTLSALRSIHSCIYSRNSSTHSTTSQMVLGAVISSDIDADKTAYLVEDSLRTGVPYGAGVDLDGVLGNLCMPSIDDMAASRKPMIGIIRSGVTAAQSIAVARNQMLSQVYWNHTNRAATAMVKYSLTRLFKSRSIDMREYIRFAMYASREECLRYLFDLHRSHLSAEGIIPMAGLMEGERRIYKRVFEVNSPTVEDSSDLNDRLINLQIERVIELEDALTTRVKLTGIPPLKRGQILLDIPTKERERQAGDRGGKVLVYDSKPASGRGRHLSDETAILKSLKEQHRQLNRVSRVFVSPSIYYGHGDWESGRKIIEQVIRNEVGF